MRTLNVLIISDLRHFLPAAGFSLVPDLQLFEGKPIYTEDSHMLVLSRKPNEQIVINGNVFVTIVSIDGNKVRIGISAPPEVPVDRAEVHQRRQEFELERATA